MSGYKYQPAAPLSSADLLADRVNLEFIWPNGPSRCTWRPGADQSTAPHVWQSHSERPAILPNILAQIGNTPMVRLNNIPKSLGIKCEMLAKCEFFNPGGSVKDRIAHRMIEDAENKGLLKEGDIIIEPTSGNTGIGLALAAAVKGYKCIIVMPMKMSDEKVNTLKALGAHVIRTPTAAGFESKEGLIAVAQKICRETPNSVILDQYRNAFNPIAHYEHTAKEILDQCGGRIDAVVLGAGTGGTVTGVGRKIKEVLPECQIVAADPLGSSLSLPEELNETDVTFYEVEGIGYDFIPTVLDRSIVDRWIKTSDKDALPMARRLISEEGLLCGGSSGTAMVAALEVAKSMEEGQRLIVLLPDSSRNYMTKFIDEKWMQARQLQSPPHTDAWWMDLPVSTLELSSPIALPINTKISEAVLIINKNKHHFIIGEERGAIKGAASSKVLLKALSSCRARVDAEIEGILSPIRAINQTSCLGHLSAILETEEIAMVIDPENPERNVIATSEDLISFIVSSNTRT